MRADLKGLAYSWAIVAIRDYKTQVYILIRLDSRKSC